MMMASSVRTLAWSKDGKQLTACGGKAARTWDAATGEPLAVVAKADCGEPLEAPPPVKRVEARLGDKVYAAVASPDGATIAVGMMHVVRLLRAKDLALVAEWDAE